MKSSSIMKFSDCLLQRLFLGVSWMRSKKTINWLNNKSRKKLQKTSKDRE